MQTFKLITILGLLCNFADCTPKLQIVRTAGPGGASHVTASITTDIKIEDVIPQLREHNFSANAMSAFLAKFEEAKAAKKPLTWTNHKLEDVLDAQRYILSRIHKVESPKTENHKTPEYELEVPENITKEEMTAFNITAQAQQAIFAKIFIATGTFANIIYWINTNKEDVALHANILTVPSKFMTEFIISANTKEAELTAKFKDPAIVQGILAKIAETKIANANASHIAWQPDSATDKAYVKIKKIIETYIIPGNEIKDMRPLQSMLRSDRFPENIGVAIEAKIMLTKADGSADVTFNETDDEQYLNPVQLIERASNGINKYLIFKDVTLQELINAKVLAGQGIEDPERKLSECADDEDATIQEIFAAWQAAEHTKSLLFTV